MQFKPGEYYWLKVNGVWEVCQAFKIEYFEQGIGFSIMSNDAAVYEIGDFSQAIHIPFPDNAEPTLLV